MGREEFHERYGQHYKNSPSEVLKGYTYQSELTKQLDQLGKSRLDRKTLYEIILWKLNRFPQIPEDLLHEINSLIDLKTGEHRKGRGVLEKLLRQKGVRLPMASAILRFRTPSVFQIIDDRAFRTLCPGEKTYPSKPTNVSDKYIKTSVKVYFNYLDKALSLANEDMPFEQIDRILYQLDIKEGNKIGGE